MGNYHVPFCRAVEGVTLSLTLIPNCGLPTGQKSLSQRAHNCQHGSGTCAVQRRVSSRQYCGLTLDRDVAAAKVIERRGKIAVGQPVIYLGARSLAPIRG